MKQRKYVVFSILLTIFTLFSMIRTFAVDGYVKVVLVGRFASGKTSLLNALLYDSEGQGKYRFDPYTQNSSTMVRRFIDVEVGMTPDNIRTIRFDIWDTAGRDLFEPEVMDLIRNHGGTDIVIIVHDLSQEYREKLRKDFDKLIKDVHSACSSCNMLFVGSKSDLMFDRSPSDFAFNCNLLECVAKCCRGGAFLKCSAKTREGVENIEKYIADFVRKNERRLRDSSTRGYDDNIEEVPFVARKSKICLLL